MHVRVSDVTAFNRTNTEVEVGDFLLQHTHRIIIIVIIIIIILHTYVRAHVRTCNLINCLIDYHNLFIFIAIYFLIFHDYIKFQISEFLQCCFHEYYVSRK